MPPFLAFRFLAGRYHATPFGHHVNEGLIEWPPSPWRLLRALISVGYTSGAWDGARPPAVALSLIDKLSSELPRYHLPAVVGAHSRHYMPTGVLDRKTRREETTLVFDTWARIGDEEMTVSWRNVRLDDAERSILGVLVSRLNYLGRSESWVEGRVMAGEPTPEVNCYPEAGETPGGGWERVALLAATSASAFASWRTERLGWSSCRLAAPARKRAIRDVASEAGRGRRTNSDRPDRLPAEGHDLATFPRLEPAPRQSARFYWRRSDAVTVGAPTAGATRRSEQAMLLSLTNNSRNDHALPPVVRTLPQAELLHRALVGTASRNGAAPPELTGRDDERRPLRGPHEHAHVNPLDLDGDGHLDHVLVWAPGGLGTDAQAAIRTVRRTFTKGGIEPLRLAVAATGDLADLVRLPGMHGHRIARVLSEGATAWQSVTPFVAPRHIKARGKNTLEGQIQAELQSRGLPTPAAIRPERHRSRFRHFVLSRRHGPSPPIICGFAVRLDFKYAIPGPIALGYGSHFGMGLFECC